MIYHLAILMYYVIIDYAWCHRYNIIGFQCIYIILTILGIGNNFLFIIWLVHIIIHLAFFILSLTIYITVINKDFYKKHPCLFWLIACVCLLLYFVLILLLFKLYVLVCQLIDDCFLQMNNNVGNSGGQGYGTGGGHNTGPGGGPSGGPGGGPSGGPVGDYRGQNKEARNQMDKDNARSRKRRAKKTEEKIAKDREKDKNDKALKRKEDDDWIDNHYSETERSEEGRKRMTGLTTILVKQKGRKKDLEVPFLRE